MELQQHNSWAHHINQTSQRGYIVSNRGTTFDKISTTIWLKHYNNSTATQTQNAQYNNLPRLSNVLSIHFILKLRLNGLVTDVFISRSHLRLPLNEIARRTSTLRRFSWVSILTDRIGCMEATIACNVDWSMMTVSSVNPKQTSEHFVSNWLAWSKWNY